MTHPGVASAIVGTINPLHLAHNVATAAAVIRRQTLMAAADPNARRSRHAANVDSEKPQQLQNPAVSRPSQPEGLSYQSVGMPLNFAQTLQRRRKIEVADTERFSLELANLGVSVRLTLNWQNRDYWVLVRQRRQDRGDVVLKLISGYVPAHELNLPLHTAIQEVAEECLIETPQGWLSGRFNDTWLPAPYAAALHYREAMPFRLSPLSGAARPVRCGNMTLMERPRAYVHLPTASLQLIYDMRLEVPKEARPLSLFHVDESLEDDQLVARLNRSRPDLYLMPLENGLPSPGALHPQARQTATGQHARPVSGRKFCAARGLGGEGRTDSLEGLAQATRPDAPPKEEPASSA